MRPRIHVLLLVVLPALVFANTLEGTYHLDDAYRVQGNPELERVFPLGRHFVDPRTSSTLPALVQYRPLLPLSLSIDVALADLFGIDRLTAFHVGNIAIHVGTCVLLYFLASALLAWSPSCVGRPALARNLAFAAAITFAVHPVAGVPVNYICGRDLSLMMLFFTGALLAYVRMRRSGDSVRGWLVVLALLALSLCSKTNSAVAGAVVLLLELTVLGAKPADARPWLRAALAALPTIVFFGFQKLVLGFSDAGQLLIDRASIWEYPRTEVVVHVFYYARNLVWPFHMRPLPRIEPVASWLEPRFLLGVAVVTATLVLAWRSRRRNPLLAFSIGAYWVLFTLTSSVFPLRAFAADYRAYPSLAFACLALAASVGGRMQARTTRAAWGAFVLYAAGASVFLNRSWRTEESFWERSVRLGGTSQAHLNYGRAVVGRDAELALHHYERALQLSPENVYARINLGILLIGLEDVQRGLAELERAVSEAPTWAIAHHWLAEGLARAGRTDEAAAARRRAADLDTRNLAYQLDAARELQRSGQVESSLRYLDRVLEREPHLADALFLAGYAHQLQGERSRAIEEYRRFLEREPRHVQARYNLACALQDEGRLEEAVRELQRVLELDPARIDAHGRLAECYRGLGDDEAARREAELYRDGR